MKRKPMELAILCLALIAPILVGSGFSIWGFTNGNKTVALWVGTAGALLVVLLCALYIQQIIWKEAVASEKSGPTDADKARLRAYMTVSQGELIFGEKTIVVRVRLRNTGQTPAYRVKAWMNWATKAAGERFVTPPIDDIPGQSDSTVGAQALIGMEQVIDTGSNPILKVAIRSAASIVYVYGRSTYLDEFGNGRTMDYRLRSIRREGDLWVLVPDSEGNTSN